MKRRDFLLTGALGVAGFALDRRSIYARSAALSIRKAVKFGMVQEPDLSIAEKFQLLKDLGFDGVEMNSPSDLD
ncbi:MAG: sugar phosphate isomerase/epimerase, partial [Candidatus Poribacteria bacterium]|nr:sugar phosphate isomerase/epimerase [Candidatus Poribacteria bacterium]